jgi:hypothetical protein
MIITIACGILYPPTVVPTSEPANKSIATIEQPQEQPDVVVPEHPTEPEPLSPQSGKVGDVIQSGSITLFVMGWENVSPLQYLNPESGNKFISTDCVVVNSGALPLALHSFSLYLKDETGQKYEQNTSASMAVGGGPQSIELSPGERLWIRQGFQIPETRAGFQFIFDPVEKYAGKIFVDLGSEPGLVHPPANLPGEQTLQIHQPDQTVVAGGLAISINAVNYSMGGEYIKPKPGNKFVVVDVTIENQSSSNIKVMIYGQMALKDSRGWVTFPTPSALIAPNEATPDGDLVPGEKIRGNVGFEILEDATGLVLMFDEDILQPPPKISIALPAAP